MFRAPALGVLALALTALPALAAGLSITVQNVDISAFPKVRVSVSVADSAGLPITGLDANAFELKEDDQVISPLRVDSVVDSQEPVATALVMDVSGSMNDDGKIDAARTAAAAFIDTFGPKDSAALISFSDQVKVVRPYTTDRAALKSAIAGLQANGDTLLYDAISQTASLQGALPERRKVILLLTDGEDTRSKQTLNAAIAATQQAGVVVFAIGLGGDVNHDVLDQLAGSGGQAIYVSDPAQLREVFLSIGDRLRRMYVLEYTSKAPADNKQHALAIKASYRGQTADIKGLYTAPKVPLALDVRGISNASRVTGVQRIDVAIGSGDARQIELLVDDQSRGLSTAPPFTFQWDTLKEQPGIHRVVLRGTDTSGAVTDKEFVLEVLAPAPAPAAPPVAVATPLPATPPVVVAPARPFWEEQTGLVVAGAALVLLLFGTGAILWIASNARPKPEPARRGPDLPDDKTIIIGAGEPLSEATVMGVRRPPELLPRAKLLIGPGQEVAVTATSETTIGRDSASSVVLDDPQASRRHARIVFKEEAFWLEDLGSTNGTRVNGETIKQHKLQPNEQIGVGDAVLTFVPDNA